MGLMKRMMLFAMCLLSWAATASVQNARVEAASVAITNGPVWYDTTGGTLQAHGGAVIKVGSTFYWIGEDKLHNSATFRNVVCYSSPDLKNWKWVGYPLKPSSHAELASSKIERPKVIYNAATGKYVMWMHYENAADYSLARVAVASSSSVCGSYTYHGSFRPLGYESRDMTVFKDDDGSAYLLSASNSGTGTNGSLASFKLTADYLNVSTFLGWVAENGHREAPAVAKQGGRYFLITSGASGWYPNQAKYMTATSMSGPWSAPQNLGNTSTFYSQSNFILPVQGTSGTAYVYMGNRWNPSLLGDSRYIWLPLTLNGSSGTASLEWHSTWNLDATTGTVSYPALVNHALGKPATASSAASGFAAGRANDGNYQAEWKATGVTWPSWWQVDLGSAKNIREVDISWFLHNGSEAYYQYRIEYSTDGANWVSLDRTANKTYGFTTDAVNFTARYVRIVLVKAVLWNNPNNWYTPILYEVQLLGG
ncbi:F5/8 type C domain-containing protein [Stigmatella aurantiaca]|uniref:F5/8 type C domain-containing protein n=2 Tax=Stigmatella aurantiaca TaxID=41 RepID=A0A1H7LJP6_STIAU|nr:F5/8 type C domain-containing protein [Stigmatella aurantiaca]